MAKHPYDVLCILIRVVTCQKYNWHLPAASEGRVQKAVRRYGSLGGSLCGTKKTGMNVIIIITEASSASFHASSSFS